MRRKGILIWCLAITIFSGMAYADGFFLEAMGSYFQPTDQNFKDIYGNGISYGGEIGITLWKGINLWVGGHYFAKKGKLTFTEEDTDIIIFPIYGGLKFRAQGESISPYIGLGLGYFIYKESNPIDTINKGDIGYTGQIGLLLKIVRSIYIDIKANYSYCKVKPLDIEANLGGLQGSIGLAFEF